MCLCLSVIFLHVLILSGIFVNCHIQHTRSLMFQNQRIQSQVQEKCLSQINIVHLDIPLFGIPVKYTKLDDIWK